MSTVPPGTCPSKIFVVRHGERHDYAEDRNWARTADRPHDPTLSREGKAQSFRLGAFLAARPDIDVRDVVVLSSPLTRCIQTAHELINGLVSKFPLLDPPSIVVEGSLCEGVFYVVDDMSRNPEAVRAIRSASLGSDTAERRMLAPLFFTPEHHKQFTSPLVQGELWHVGPAPTYFCDAFNSIQEEINCEDRCRAGAHGLFAECAEYNLSGKVVICVGHQETAAIWADCLTGIPFERFAATYTAFVEIVPKVADDGNTRLHCVAWDAATNQLVPAFRFATPHLMNA